MRVGFRGRDCEELVVEVGKPAAAFARLGWMRLDKYMVPAVLNPYLDKLLENNKALTVN